jgi:hypothetical protein
MKHIKGQVVSLKRRGRILVRQCDPIRLDDAVM